MCVCDPAHPHFWHKRLPNEGQIENPQVSFKKMCMNKKRSPQTHIT